MLLIDSDFSYNNPMLDNWDQAKKKKKLKKKKSKDLERLLMYTVHCHLSAALYWFKTYKYNQQFEVKEFFFLMFALNKPGD